MGVGFKSPPTSQLFVRLIPLAIGVFVLSVILMKLVFPQFAYGPRLHQVPEICQAGVAQSEFNQKKCEEFWSGRYVEMAIATAPFWLALAFLFLTHDSVTGTYKRIRKRVDSTKTLMTGVVTNPALTANDRFGWLHCFQAVKVQLADGKQVRAYLASDASIPLPGEKLALVDIGQKRYVGIHFAPHIAVFRG